MIDEYIDVVIECDEDMEACFGEIQQVPMRANYDQTDPNAVDYILGREKLLSKDEIKLDIGEGEDSIQQEGAKALGPRTIALGTSVAGCKGYYYSGIDFTNKYIYLSLVQSVPVGFEVITVSAPANLVFYPNKYYVITTNGTQVSFSNVTLKDPTNTDIVNEYKFRVNGISRLQFYTQSGSVASITGLPATYEQDKFYDITIIGGVAKYTVSNVKDPFYDASFTPEWQVGDAFSIVNSSHYDEIGTITSIDGNRIGYDTIGFDEINLNDSALEDFDSYTIVVPTRPECGVINLGEGAFSAGTDVKATGRYSSSFGRQNRSFGDYSFTAGRKCFAAYASGAVGYECEALGQGSFSAGWQSKSTGKNSVTLGGGLINPYDNAVIGGWCNDPTIPDLLWGIGYGFNGVRKNAFNVNKYGDVWVDKDPTMPMGVATKQYVDNNAAPDGLITRSIINPSTNEEFEAKLKEVWYSVPIGTVAYCHVTDNLGVTSLGGGQSTLEIYRQLSEYGIIKATGYNGNIGNAGMVRLIYNGLWGEWEWQNPPLYPGVEYRTTERWYGKPVYALQCHLGLLPAVGTTADIQHGISCTQVIRTEGQMLYDGNLYGGDSLPYYRDDYGADIRITSTRFGIKLSVVAWDKDPSVLSNVEASATIYYVKE